MDTAPTPSFVSKFALFFVNNWRVSILLTIGILLGGFFSYTTLLQREGFPSIEVPVVLVNVQYFVDDQEQVDTEITQPLEQNLSNIDNLNQMSSTSAEQFSQIVLQFEEGADVSQVSKTVQERINTEIKLPERAQASVSTINPGAFDGTHDLLFNITKNNTSAEELQETATTIIDDLQSLSTVSEAQVIQVVEEQKNPRNEQIIQNEKRFGRVGFTQDQELVFQEAILIGIKKTSDAGSIELSNQVQEKVDTLQKAEEPLENHQAIFGYTDGANSLRQQISTLEENATFGLLAVMAILLLFINWRSAILMALFVPTVMAGTFIGLYLFGFTLNTLSLFALILVLGIIADDAIVVIDALDASRKAGYKGKEALVQAINTVGIADISGSLTTILVFAPLAAITGVLGEFIRLIPITVILTLSLSLIIGLSLIPFLGHFLLPSYEEKPLNKSLFAIVGEYITSGLYLVPEFIDWLGGQVARFIKWYITKPFTFFLGLLLIISLIGGSFLYGMSLEFSIFAPPKDTEGISISIESQEQDLDDVEDLSTQAEEILQQTASSIVTDVTYVQAQESGAQALITLTPIKERETTSQELVSSLNKTFEDSIDEGTVEAEALGAGPPSSDFQITLQVFEENRETLLNAIEEIEALIKQKQLTNGQITQVEIADQENLSRIDQEQFASVKIAVSNPDDTELITETRDDILTSIQDEGILEEYGLSEENISFDLGQEGENLESFQSAIFALGVAMIVMYAVLVLQFNSFTQPILILTAIPLTLPGVFPGLFYTENPFSFFTMVGFIGLIGIVVNNTILILDYSNQAKKHLSLSEAVTQASQARFRPLLATSATTLVGIMPLALSDPFWEPLAFTIIFGLLSSSILVVFAFPLFYIIIEHIRRFFWRRIIRQFDFE